MFLMLLLQVPDLFSQTTFVPYGAHWHYLDDGSNQGEAWHRPAFDHSHWASGPAELGYGERDEATLVSFGPSAANKHITTYFRHVFRIKNPGNVPGLRFDIIRDDGAVLYVNGQRVFGTNMPLGEINYQTLAVTSLSGLNERIPETFVIPPDILVAGENVVAVEIHKASPANSDLSFDLRITDAIGATAPFIENCTLRMNSSAPTVAISSQNISARDISSNEASLRFTVSDLESGRFEMITNPGKAVRMFTQGQIAAGLVRFVYTPGRFGAATGDVLLADPLGRNEVSGVVASIRNPNLLWAIEDSDNAASLLALGTDGSDRGDWILPGATNIDWEDIAAATIGGQEFIYVGDFGDNFAARSQQAIYRVREPLVTGNFGGVVPFGDIERIIIQYPEYPAGERGDGSFGIPARRDAEGLLVDPMSGDIYVFSKREFRCRIFRLAHQESYTGLQTLEYVGDMPALIRDSVGTATAVDISRDGLEVGIRNFEHIFFYRREDLTTSLADLLTGTQVEQLPFVGSAPYPSGEPKGEAIWFSANGDAIFTLGENLSRSVNVPLFRYPRLPRRPPPAFSISVSDGALSAGPQPAVIFFNEGPVESWRHGFFTAGELSDPALEETLWGDNADPDHDGVFNILEYAFDSDPRKAGDNTNNVVLSADPFTDGLSFSFTYRKDLSREGIAYQVELSDDATSWLPADDTLVTTENGVETRRVSVSAAGHPERWVRLRISRKQ